MRVNTTVSFQNCDPNAAELVHLLRGDCLLAAASLVNWLGVPPDS